MDQLHPLFAINCPQRGLRNLGNTTATGFSSAITHNIVIGRVCASAGDGGDSQNATEALPRKLKYKQVGLVPI